ncbi:MAG: hypothetical protein Q8R78_06990 [Candidatus Omnitrophota bacterium]|nr:hypothetical protein [Candidatus Omnitrophota bacterium]
MGARQQQREQTFQRGKRGFFLLAVLTLIAFLSTLISVSLTRATTERAAATRFADHEQAFQLAEAGIEDARVVLNASSFEWTDELVGADGLAGTADDGRLTLEPADLYPNTAYTVQLLDNTDEVAPATNNPTADVDGVIRVLSTGTVGQSRRQIEVSLWALFNHAMAAQTYILLRQINALGSLHANGDILIDQQSTLFGCARATASGIVDQSKASLIYDPLCGAVASEVPPITFPRPDETALRAAVKPENWNLPNTTATITLPVQEVVGYDVPLSDLPNTPQTIRFAGGAAGPGTLVMFDGHSICIREKIGGFKKIQGKEVCTDPIDLNIIAIGGFIEFQQPVCLRGLIWAEGSITIAQGSSISGAIVSAGSYIDVKQSSSISFNRSVMQSLLLPGFSDSTVLSWQEQ